MDEEPRAGSRRAPAARPTGVCCRVRPPPAAASRTEGPMSHEQIAIPTADGACRSFVFRPEGEGPWPGAIFYMDGLGIRPVTRRKKYSAKPTWPINSLHRSRPRTSMRSGQDAQIDV